jgi:hypothetical protein
MGLLPVYRPSPLKTFEGDYTGQFFSSAKMSLVSHSIARMALRREGVAIVQQSFSMDSRTG